LIASEISISAWASKNSLSALAVLALSGTTGISLPSGSSRVASSEGPSLRTSARLSASIALLRATRQANTGNGPLQRNCCAAIEAQASSTTLQGSMPAMTS
jgi:hypothetical protein